MHASVLVAGAGPTGATLAAYLARRGVDIICIDEKDGPEPHSKAGNLWPRTLEMLGMVPGALERIVPRSHPLSVLNVYGFGTITARVPADRYDSPHPAALLNGQDVIEAALWDEAAEAGAPVRTGHRLVGLATGHRLVGLVQTADGVAAQVEGPDGPGEITATGSPGARARPRPCATRRAWGSSPPRARARSCA